LEVSSVTTQTGLQPPHVLDRSGLEVLRGVLETTRAIRKGLDLGREVPREVIEECLEIAVHAPCAEAREPWRFLVLTDPAKRRVLAEYYRLSWEVFQFTGSGRRRTRWREAKTERVRASAQWLAHNLERVPVLILVCVAGRAMSAAEAAATERTWMWPDGIEGPRPVALSSYHATYYASIFPAVWSLQLALRAKGLGSTITTMHLPFEHFVADELGIPRGAQQVALLPVAYAREGVFRVPERKSAAEVTYWNTWEEPRFVGTAYRDLIAKGAEEHRGVHLDVGSGRAEGSGGQPGATDPEEE
jgi:nitroreductase